MYFQGKDLIYRSVGSGLSTTELEIMISPCDTHLVPSRASGRVVLLVEYMVDDLFKDAILLKHCKMMSDCLALKDVKSFAIGANKFDC